MILVLCFLIGTIAGLRAMTAPAAVAWAASVSYTHLTLPTICSV